MNRSVLRAGVIFFLFLLPSCAKRAVLCDQPPGEMKVVEALRDPNLRLLWPAAHRGDRNSGPDNSTESITAAAKYGVPLIETDIRFSIDGTPFLFHDRTVRQVNIEGPPELFERPTSSLRDSDIASIRLPSTGSPVLFFTDALEVVRPYKAVLELDIKGETPEQLDLLMMLAYRAGLPERLVVQCQKFETLEYMREHHPDIAILARVHSMEEISRALPYHPEIIFAEESVITPQAIRVIHDAGSKAGVKIMGKDTDTVDAWERLYKSGADILMTDHGNKLMWHVRNKFCPAPGKSMN